jgi:serine/threonine-protein kinase HipA
MIFNTTTWSKYVFIALEGAAEAVPAGKLELLEEGIKPVGSTFVYGNKYLQRANAAAVDPVSMPLDEAKKSKETVFQPPAGLALFGAIRDAAPDSWGRRVIENMLRAAPDGLPETEYLAHAGPHRTGALDFRNSPTAPAEPG